MERVRPGVSPLRRYATRTPSVGLKTNGRGLMNSTGSRVRFVDAATSPHFDAPTTVASCRRSFYLSNTRFGNASPQTADYWITAIPSF